MNDEDDEEDEDEDEDRIRVWLSGLQPTFFLLH